MPQNRSRRWRTWVKKTTREGFIFTTHLLHQGHPHPHRRTKNSESPNIIGSPDDQKPRRRRTRAFTTPQTILRIRCLHGLYTYATRRLYEAPATSTMTMPHRSTPQARGRQADALAMKLSFHKIIGQLSSSGIFLGQVPQKPTSRVRVGACIVQHQTPS